MIRNLIRILPYLLLTSLLPGCVKSSSQERGEDIPVLKSGGQPMPDEWIDADTKHRIIRLTKREKGGRSFYFHNYPFVKAENGDDVMVFYGNTDSGRQIFSVNLNTKAIEQVTSHPSRFGGEIVSGSTGEVFYQSSDSVFATNILTKESRLVYVFPDDFKARISTINADGTLLAGSFALPVKDSIYRANPEKKDYFNLIYEAKVPHTLFTVNTQSGALKKLYQERAWLNHVQFSPTDPDLLMYCHEGPWHLVDRIWTIDVQTGKNKLMHERTMHREIAGHEFFGPDGKTIWYDLQRPRGETFFLAGVNVENGERTVYQMDRDEWSIHFNISPDQQLFAGDGGDSTQVALAENGCWIYLFTPSGESLKAEKLVNMEYHSYRPIEPNVHFSPDGQWVIFRSDLDGTLHTYAVKI
ncbi:oligogalacturonate lyase family protein [Marinoscillum sp. MHG1-6]|uniref:oligogalacturonate lyase family protein n=1 Tax=Marinoscillum sp. MHG1-6 TaxID=2959627 RepID=UPI002157CCF3|nr:oligogalacturonate lyase family protein [Marinoscillum sp. MHG1-6]